MSSSSSVDFNTDINLKNNHKITFDNAVLIGRPSTTSITTGSGKEIAIGANTNASLNSVAIGYNVDQNNKSTKRNVLIGQNVAQTVGYAYNSVIIGYNACQHVGLENGFSESVFIGPRAGRHFGANGLYSSGETFVGYGAGAYMGEYGGTNVGVGFRALWNGSGDNNVAVGSQSMAASKTKTRHNVCLGHKSGYRLFDSNYNVILGSSAQVTSASINNSIIIGSGARCSSSTTYNTAIGTSATMNHSQNSVLIGGKTRLGSLAATTKSDHSVVIGGDNTVGLNSPVTGNFEHTTILGAKNFISQGTRRNDIIIGTNNAVNHSNCIVIGSYNTTTKDNSLLLGSSTLPLEITTGATDPMNGQAPPGNVQAFLNVFVNGTEYKLPLYSV